MKPIELIISGFGPFAGTMEPIRFEDFEKEGLFLITGNTGAGKTTIFDAICYALYGETSGQYRNDNQKHLRCDKAPADVPTFVEFTFEHQGKIYKVKRNPYYMRKNLRGEGMTEEKPKAVLTFPDGRTEEKWSIVNKKIIDILNVNYEQFMKVAMIAQGQFYQLLNAEAKDKTNILRNIFMTSKYNSIESKLKERKDKLEAEKQEIENSIVQYFNDVESGNDEQLSEKLALLQQTAGTCDISDMLGIIKEQVSFDEAELEKLSKEISKQEKESKKANDALATAKDNNKALDNLKKTEEKAQSLKERKPEIEKLERDYDKQKIASRNIKPKYDDCEKLNKELQSEQEGLSKATESQKLTEQKVNEAEASLKAAQKEQEEKTAQYKKTMEDLKDIPEQLAKANSQTSSINKIFDECINAENFVDKTYAAEKNNLADKQSGFKRAEAAMLKAKSDYDEAERILSYNRAGLLARDLEEGSPCPVCGSTHHPTLATLTKDSISEEEVERLRGVYESKNADRQQACIDAEKAKNELETLEKQIVKSLLDIYGNELVDIKTSDTDLEKLTKHLNETKNKIESQKDENGKLLVELAADKEAYDEASNCLAEISSGDSKEVAKARNKLSEAKEYLSAIKSTIDNHNKRIEELKKNFETAKALLDEALKENGYKGFSDESFKEYCRSENELEKIDKEINEFKNAESRIKGEIEAAQKAAEGKTYIDITALESICMTNDEKLGESRKLSGDIQRRIENNNRYQTRIDDLKKSHEDVYNKYKPLYKLHEAVVGKISGKKVTLEQFVLARGYDGILAAANRRLLQISDGQYELYRDDSEGEKNKNNFLNLVVLDNYTGKKRPVGTLSGGESFNATLSLALGLSDTISQSRGGIQMDALFIDEGFGTLDNNMIENVLRILNDLSGKGKLVGIISHREELNVINQKILVSKDNKGSHIAVEV